MDPFPKDGESAAGGEPSRGAAPSSGVVVQVREKKGPLRAAIPYMPFPVAVICLFLNTFVPGLGTFVSAFTVLCGARTDLPDRHMCCVFWLNIAAALIQILTAIVMVGWIMSIFWGMDMVILAIPDEESLSSYHDSISSHPLWWQPRRLRGVSMSYVNQLYIIRQVAALGSFLLSH
ncbi:protein stum homolog isoform X1 [Lathamus discolor]|uniref:protein stum homolog isoform X1 n=1 Tax=Lathamus discolor TaxID=678569 RepID=UPI0032B7771F